MIDHNYTILTVVNNNVQKCSQLAVYHKLIMVIILIVYLNCSAVKS